MADIIKLMDQPVTVNGLTQQPLFEAIDVSQYNYLNLMLSVVGVTGAGSIEVAIETSMQNAAESISGGTTNGWTQVGKFTAQTGSGVYEIKTLTNLARYVRWRVLTYSGFTNVTLTISGMARRRTRV